MLLFALLLSASAWAQEIKTITWTQSDDGKYTGRVNLTAPAPDGGAKVIFEPTFHFQLPYSVTVPAGQLSVDFPLPLTDNAFMQGMTLIPEAGWSNGGLDSEVSAFCNGKLYTGPGPNRSRTI